MNIRALIENPFRKYAVFTGRARRAEFWLFALTFLVITQLAWLAGFGAMKIVGLDDAYRDSSASFQMDRSEYGGPEDGGGEDGGGKDGGGPSGDNLADDKVSRDMEADTTPTPPGGHSARNSNRDSTYDDPHHRVQKPDQDRLHDDDILNFMIHRHGGEGYHLHGVMPKRHGMSDGHRGRDTLYGHERYQHRDWNHDRDGYPRNGFRDYDGFRHGQAERGGDILWMISFVALLLPLMAVGARRLHDSNHSGWWQLMALIPVAGWLVLMIFFLLPGDEADNRYGAPTTF